jgi:hypothetical protein
MHWASVLGGVFIVMRQVMVAFTYVASYSIGAEGCSIVFMKCTPRDASILPRD